ncbi:hypothetical protein HanIR_Chr14g0709351 [Helianthus annuus]|nr:hypothetical protein HanIR_Chr14g0709351 [Helianthus annuus]
MIQLCFFYCQRVSWALSIVLDVYVYLVMWFICRVSDLFGCVLLSWFLNIRVGYHRCLFFDLLWTCCLFCWYLGLFNNQRV